MSFGNFQESPFLYIVVLFSSNRINFFRYSFFGICQIACRILYVSVCVCFSSSGERIYGLHKFLNGNIKNKMFRITILKDHSLYLPIFLPRFL